MGSDPLVRCRHGVHIRLVDNKEKETEDAIMIREDTKAETLNKASKTDPVLNALKRNGEEAAIFEEALAQ